MSANQVYLKGSIATGGTYLFSFLANSAYLGLLAYTNFSITGAAATPSITSSISAVGLVGSTVGGAAAPSEAKWSYTSKRTLEATLAGARLTAAYPLAWAPPAGRDPASIDKPYSETRAIPLFAIPVANLGSYQGRAWQAAEVNFEEIPSNSGFYIIRETLLNRYLKPTFWSSDQTLVFLTPAAAIPTEYTRIEKAA
jgi:hypothetical protein